MILIAEIILTITAWRKGWRGWALLPMGIALGIAFIIGLALGASGGTVEDIAGMAIFLDIAGIVALIGMNVSAPRHKEHLEDGALQSDESLQA